MIPSSVLARSHPALLASLLFCASACTAAFAGSENSAAAGVTISDAWVRSSPPGTQVGAGYATLHNDSNHLITIEKVSSDASASAELHEMMMHGAMMHMTRLESGLSLKPGQTMSLEPGGTHLMLLGLHHPLVSGSSVQLRFQTSDGHEVSVEAPVRDSAP